MALLVKNPTANTGDLREEGSIPGSGRSPGGERDNPLQYSCLENSTDRGVWWATVHGATESQTWLKWLSTAQRNQVIKWWWWLLVSTLSHLGQGSQAVTQGTIASHDSVPKEGKCPSYSVGEDTAGLDPGVHNITCQYMLSTWRKEKSTKFFTLCNIVNSVLFNVCF